MSNSAMSIEQIHAHSLLATTFDHPRQVLASPFLDQPKSGAFWPLGHQTHSRSRVGPGCVRSPDPAVRSV